MCIFGNIQGITSRTEVIILRIASFTIAQNTILLSVIS